MMNREDIARMAREAGDDWDDTLPSDKEFLERFAELVAEAEREACARLIVDAYNAGKEDGDEEGYKRGYEDGVCEGRRPRLVVGDGRVYEEEDEEEMSSKEFYDAGWKDGYCGKDLNLTMKEDKVYLWGYQDGREEYCREDGEEESK